MKKLTKIMNVTDHPVAVSWVELGSGSILLTMATEEQRKELEPYVASGELKVE